jgi:uncharacterized protein
MRTSRIYGFALGMGALFGTGLIVAGMTDTGNVQGFLDLAGAWRPQLLAVLGTAVTVAFLLFARARKLGAPLAAQHFHWPTRRDLDTRLIGGSILFGAGWALAGYCPGPALTSLGALSPEAWVFVAAMAIGMWVVQRFR